MATFERGEFPSFDEETTHSLARTKKKKEAEFFFSSCETGNDGLEFLLAVNVENGFGHGD